MSLRSLARLRKVISTQITKPRHILATLKHATRNLPGGEKRSFHLSYPLGSSSAHAPYFLPGRNPGSSARRILPALLVATVLRLPALRRRVARGRQEALANMPEIMTWPSPVVIVHNRQQLPGYRAEMPAAETTVPGRAAPAVRQTQQNRHLVPCCPTSPDPNKAEARGLEPGVEVSTST